MARDGAITRSPQTAQVGDIVLVHVDQGVDRPMLVTWAGMADIHTRATPTAAPAEFHQEFRVSGTIFCEPDDHTRPAFRGVFDRPHDPARIQGRPDRMLPLAYAECLSYGVELGQWRLR